jgi:hypothetical protein
MQNVKDPPEAFMGPKRFAVLANAEEQPLQDVELILWWKNVHDISGEKTIFVDVQIYCFDVAGRHHETVYNLVIFERPTLVTNSIDPMAPGVVVARRRRIVQEGWLRRVRARARYTMQSVPLVSRAFRDK